MALHRPPALTRAMGVASLYLLVVTLQSASADSCDDSYCDSRMGSDCCAATWLGEETKCTDGRAPKDVGSCFMRSRQFTCCLADSPPPPPRSTGGSCPSGWVLDASSQTCFGLMRAHTPYRFCEASCANAASGGRQACITSSRQNALISAGLLGSVSPSCCGFHSQSCCVFLGLRQWPTDQGARANWDHWRNDCHSDFTKCARTLHAAPHDSLPTHPHPTCHRPLAPRPIAPCRGWPPKAAHVTTACARMRTQLVPRSAQRRWRQ